MMRVSIRPVAGIVLFLLMAPVMPHLRIDAAMAGAPLHPGHPAAALSRSFDRLPLQFEINEGQAGSDVRYIAHLAHATLALTATHIALTLQQPTASAAGAPRALLGALTAHSSRHAAGETVPALQEGGSAKSTTIDMRPLGSNPHARVVGLERLPGRVNYLLGASPRGWHTNIPVYARVAYRNIYPRIDLVFYGHGGQVEYDWVLHPGARIASIRLMMAGGATTVGRDRSLQIHTGLGDIRQSRPRLYQQAGRAVSLVRGGYSRSTAGSIGFWAGAHDPRRTLIIDPILQYATYVGGSGSDWGADIAVDGRGDAYIVGSTVSPDYPLLHPLPGPGFSSQQNAVVTRLNAAGNALLSSTYLGGEGDDDGEGIALDRAGNMYVTGLTRSVGFPSVHPLPGSACNRDQFRRGDVFVSELSPRGNSLLFSTCLGGSDTDWPAGIAIDRSGALLICGGTGSDNFPTRNAFQPHRAGGSDTFVARILHGRLTFSTYFGGSGDDATGGMAVDAAGNVTLAGTTESDNFPVLQAVQSRHAGGGGENGDAFVARFSSSGTPIFSTYLGGRNDDGASAVAVDAEGSVYVAGLTASPDFPTSNPAQGTLAGGIDAFVTKLAPSGTVIQYSTLLGGAERDAATGIALDAAGNAYVTGTTSSSDFPVVSPIQAQGGGGNPYEDVFVAEMDPAGKTAFSTYLGGSGVDISSRIVVDRQGAVYLTGGTSSTDFPITVGLAGTSPDRGNAFIIKLLPGGTGNGDDRVTVDRLDLFQPDKHGTEVRTDVVQPGRKVLFISRYHTIGISASAVRATLRFTAARKTIVTRTMRQVTSVDRRPTFAMVWRVPRTVQGQVVAHASLAVGTATATRTLRFKIVASR